ncbi:alpha/beta hydrolase, partial [Salmonella enterica]|nr:alpha/beta hydrolase [Salmonella enterica]
MTEQFILTSNDQQTQLNVRHWPCPSPKAVVQLIHGMAEHIQRYDEFARFLNQLGFAVIGHDHLGHGESVQPSAPIYGFFGEQGPENVVTDIHQVKQWAVN